MIKDKFFIPEKIKKAQVIHSQYMKMTARYLV
jgi:hypothetical protein